MSESNAMEWSFPFKSMEGDRKYSADDWAEYYNELFTTGVFYKNSDALRVSALEGMTLKIGKGAAFILGRAGRVRTDKTVTLEIADGVLNRIDRIVIRCDYGERKVKLVIKKGTGSAQPVAPELQRDADAYEIALADVFVGKGVTTIKGGNITDCRLNKDLCGIVTSTVLEIDTTEIFNQFESWFEEISEQYEDWYSPTKEQLEQLAITMNKQATLARQATERADNFVSATEAQIAAGIFKGETGAQGIQGVKGDKGEKGDSGENGIIVPITGYFTLSCDNEGNLYAHYSNEATAPAFEFDEATGNVYLITPET